MAECQNCGDPKYREAEPCATCGSAEKRVVFERVSLGYLYPAEAEEVDRLIRWIVIISILAAFVIATVYFLVQ